MKPLGCKKLHHPTTSITLCRMPHLNNKKNKNTNPIISKQDYHLTQPCPSEQKQTKKNSAQISPYMMLIQTTGPSLGVQKPKEEVIQPFSRKEFNFPWNLGDANGKSLQLCLTLCDPIDGSPWDSPVPGILKARTLEWVAVSFSNAWKWKVKVKSLSHVQLLATLWTAVYQAPPSMGFSRQEYWSGVPLPSLTFIVYGVTKSQT